MIDLIEYLRKISGRVLILSHQNADIDAVSSSIALKEALQILNPNVTVEMGAAKSLAKEAKKIADEFFSNFSINPSTDAELLILLDTSTLLQISPLEEEIKKASKIAVIDHHTPHMDTKNVADFYVIDEHASSTAEIVYQLINEMGIKVDTDVAFVILIGILSDSARLRFASSKTIGIVKELLDRGADYTKALEFLEVKEDLSQKIAQLKAAQRMRFYRVMDWILAISEVSAFGAHAAKVLILLGADCAFVGSLEDDGKIQISSRCSSNFSKKTGIHLGRDIMPKIGELIEGSGGGHVGAAGAKGKKGDMKKILEKCIKVTEELICSKEGQKVQNSAS